MAVFLVSKKTLMTMQVSGHKMGQRFPAKIPQLPMIFVREVIKIGGLVGTPLTEQAGSKGMIPARLRNMFDVST